ncbi:hypothetical protein C8F04DRAFT_1183192 [Mycena alexandri]|uniref:Uncharacterized protein n=1 Tax=Mycena alexandri TaxID=1745969 RepID=A0AAD6X2M8_9AGAR|nr:hypothetical protein C8F04DRAFT_1183192 [Mycena alexandri]
MASPVHLFFCGNQSPPRVEDARSCSVNEIQYSTLRLRKKSSVQQIYRPFIVTGRIYASRKRRTTPGQNRTGAEYQRNVPARPAAPLRTRYVHESNIICPACEGADKICVEMKRGSAGLPLEPMLLSPPHPDPAPAEAPPVCTLRKTDEVPPPSSAGDTPKKVESATSGSILSKTPHHPRTHPMDHGETLRTSARRTTPEASYTPHPQQRCSTPTEVAQCGDGAASENRPSIPLHKRREAETRRDA